jgi:hypothetical protein
MYTLLSFIFSPISANFKKEFWENLITGQKPRDIVVNLSIDPDILGDVRIRGLKSMIRNEVKARNGFRDLGNISRFHEWIYVT